MSRLERMLPNAEELERELQVLRIEFRHVQAVNAELERQIDTLEFALTAARTIAEVGLETASSIAAERGEGCPPANPLNTESAS